MIYKVFLYVKYLKPSPLYPRQYIYSYSKILYLKCSCANTIVIFSKSDIKMIIALTKPIKIFN